MRQLTEVAKRNGNRVILSGDYSQHSSVEAGDAFRLLEKEAGVKLARFTQIRRQTMPGYNKAVEAISEAPEKPCRKDSTPWTRWAGLSNRPAMNGTAT